MVPGCCLLVPRPGCACSLGASDGTLGALTPGPCGLGPARIPCIAPALSDLCGSLLRILWWCPLCGWFCDSQTSVHARSCPTCGPYTMLSRVSACSRARRTRTPVPWVGVPDADSRRDQAPRAEHPPLQIGLCPHAVSSSFVLETGIRAWNLAQIEMDFFCGKDTSCEVLLIPAQ